MKIGIREIINELCADKYYESEIEEPDEICMSNIKNMGEVDEELIHIQNVLFSNDKNYLL